MSPSSTISPKRPSRLLVLGGVLALFGLLAACGGDSEFNDADVTFAQEMVPHHSQATEMAALAPTRTENADVLDLATRIEAAQDPEIDTMKGWLESWGKDDSHGSHSSHGDMEGMKSMDDMPGMMSDSQLTELKASSGATFDRLFLTMMTEHHEGAITMAETEQSKGMYADAVKLAKTIQSTQRAEIAEMKKLLARS
ncbi:hypothetical protein ASD11_07920 [Aeromicrobium sp. Root495]|uniref:DUF305 domain-containing protein n=1 Tax=Aeromicrobium sp. Root495 TaxID=1736550 RepID=UPI0006FD4315|nr:DUF305 domain-containing protein [Aeromicrobium sp. Root495]KQY59479.1 hypothetical protein ASD11_07920 [Aeromicrobium sp. Root495]